MSVSSYHLSERVNAQTILFWTVAIPIYRAGLAIDRSCQAIQAALPALLFALAIITKALCLAAGLIAAFALVAAFWLPIVQFAGALTIIAAFAYMTYPRTQAVQA
jgi:hypothetical protein